MQEALYGNVHSLTLGCGEALHRMLAFEKEHAVMRTKCTDDAVWERYKPVRLGLGLGCGRGSGSDTSRCD